MVTRAIGNPTHRYFVLVTDPRATKYLNLSEVRDHSKITSPERWGQELPKMVTKSDKE